MHARDGRHDRGDLFALLLESLQVVAEDLERQRALGAGHRLADVVFNRLREVPDRSWIFLHREVHGGDQFLLVPVKDRAPLVVRLQVDEILGVAESAGVGSVVGPADLRHHVCDLRETTRRHSRSLVGELLAFRKAGAVCQRAARPDSAFIQVRQELRADDAAKAQIDGSGQGDERHSQRRPSDAQWPSAAACGSASVRNSMTRLRRSLMPCGRSMLASTGAMRMENVMAPRRAKATVQAMGRNSRPSTRCSVKMGR